MCRREEDESQSTVPLAKDGCLGKGFQGDTGCLLGGSWAVISGVTTRVTIVITQINGLIITPLLTTHVPPSGIVWCLTIGSQAETLTPTRTLKPQALDTQSNKP